MSRSGNFCGDRRTEPIALPLAHARGVKMQGAPLYAAGGVLAGFYGTSEYMYQFHRA
jgi:hypothetical protein